LNTTDVSCSFSSLVLVVDFRPVFEEEDGTKDVDEGQV
jgi:hypothetical protein